jgi:hypothetical protein
MLSQSVSTQPLLNQPLVQIHREATQAYVEGLQKHLDPQGQPQSFSEAQHIAKHYLGSRRHDEHLALIGFWVPGLTTGTLQGKTDAFYLEVFMPQDNLQLNTWERGEQRVHAMQRVCLPIVACGDFLLGVYEGLPFGNESNDGAFYWLRFKTSPQNTTEEAFILRDPLGYSFPFGVYAPTELYDMAGVLARRKDMAYFTQHYSHRYEDGSYRAKSIGTTLEIHPETATSQGTLAALTEKLQRIAKKILENRSQGQADTAGLTPSECLYLGFDTFELTPEVPPVEREATTHPYGEFFQYESTEHHTTPEPIPVSLKKPDISNWGYDTPIIGTASINPSITQSGKPHELLAFIETLHTFPTPIQLSLDAVLGHADFQGAALLATPEGESALPELLKYTHSAYFRGANMYGRDLAYSTPMVRAILLEMYRRKIQYGYDCVRVDGGQDFVQTVDPTTGFRIQDDAFIQAMVTTHQTVGEGSQYPIIQRRLDMNVEDGRPWPNDMNWLYNATYTEHILGRQLPDNDRVKQWGSLIFAHNVHGKFKWFQTKWDRFKDTFKDGENWITGHSNHDNARYFYRLTLPQAGSRYQEGTSVEAYYNDHLGEDYQSATHNALDNPALSALVLGFLPGAPMFFLNALVHTPWLFFRNTDCQYGVKVVADEGNRFLNWYINEARYQRPELFPRLKALGFHTRHSLAKDPQHQDAPQGFLDVLFEHHERIKTDATMVLSLVDPPESSQCPEGLGWFDTLGALQGYTQSLLNPFDDAKRNTLAQILKQIQKDTLESERKVHFARAFLERMAVYHPDVQHDPVAQKIAYLRYLAQSTMPSDRQAFARLLEASAQEHAYDLEAWAKIPELIACCPEALKPLTPEKLKQFAMAFMEDAKESTQVHRYESALSETTTQYHYSLRAFRQENPWLAYNPVNDLTKDFFNRRIIVNGAKNTGAFFSDKGDTILSNTLYYGWRTNPEGKKQVALIAMMEGAPLPRLSLQEYLPPQMTEAPTAWEVVAVSEGLSSQVGKEVASNLVLTHITNGQALLLTRSLP